MPLDVEIVQSLIVEGIHRLKLHLKPKARLSTSGVALGVLGLEDGEVLQMRERRLDEVVDAPYVEPGSVLAMSFSLDNPQISEYQVRCRWGDGAVSKESEELLGAARGRIKEVAEAVGSAGGLSLRDVSISRKFFDCSSPPCDYYYVLSFVLANEGAGAVGDIDMALGLYWREGGAELDLPRDGEPISDAETSIPLSGVTLSPGDRRKTELSVDRAIPVLPGGVFVPHLRILSYSPVE